MIIDDRGHAAVRCCPQWVGPMAHSADPRTPDPYHEFKTAQ
jgi:hypothetical protein